MLLMTRKKKTVGDKDITDSLVVFAGTNDIEGSNSNLLQEVSKLVQLSTNTSLTVIGLHYRRDRRNLNNQLISKINADISIIMPLDQLFKSQNVYQI